MINSTAGMFQVHKKHTRRLMELKGVAVQRRCHPMLKKRGNQFLQ